MNPEKALPFHRSAPKDFPLHRWVTWIKQVLSGRSEGGGEENPTPSVYLKKTKQNETKKTFKSKITGKFIPTMRPTGDKSEGSRNFEQIPAQWNVPPAGCKVWAFFLLVLVLLR